MLSWKHFRQSLTTIYDTRSRTLLPMGDDAEVPRYARFNETIGGRVARRHCSQRFLVDRVAYFG